MFMGMTATTSGQATLLADTLDRGPTTDLQDVITGIAQCVKPSLSEDTSLFGLCALVGMKLA